MFVMYEVIIIKFMKLKRKSKFLAIIIAIAIVFSMTAGISYLKEPAKLMADKNFLKASDKWANTTGYGPYIYQTFNLKIGGVSRTFALTNYLFAGYHKPHTETYSLVYNYSHYKGVASENIGMGIAFDLVMLANNGGSIGVHVNSVTLFNKSVSFTPPSLFVLAHGDFKNYSVNWCFPNPYVINPHFTYFMQINIELFNEVGPFYYPIGNYVLNATQFPVSIVGTGL